MYTLQHTKINTHTIDHSNSIVSSSIHSLICSLVVIMNEVFLVLKSDYSSPRSSYIVANHPRTSGTLPDFLPLSQEGPRWPSSGPLSQNSNVHLFSHTLNARLFPYNAIKYPFAHVLIKGAVPAYI